jgi:Tol biopolymer transport system component
MQGTSLISLMAVAGVTWSPDSKRLACVGCSAFDMSHLRPDEGTLLVVDCAAGTVTPVVKVRAGLVAAPKWSPDGRRVTFIYLPWAWIDYLMERPEAAKPLPIPERESLRLYDVETATVSRICNLPGEGWAPCTRLEWSADSRRIGLVTLDTGPQGRATAWTVTATTGATPKRAATGISAAATWGRDLAALAFLEDRDNEVVLIYRGLHPATRRALTTLSRADSLSLSGAELAAPQPNPDTFAMPYSLPDLSPNGSRIALRVPQTLDLSGILVLDLTSNSKTPGR